MSSAASGNKLLEERDRRHALLLEALAAATPSTLFLSLNIPGEEKSPEGAGELFEWGVQRTVAALDARAVHRSDDRLGPLAILSSGADPTSAKSTAVLLENAVPAARLLDIDVYDSGGNQIGRRELGLPPRPCLLCAEAAADCIRLARHPHSLLKARTDELLRSFHP